MWFSIFIYFYFSINTIAIYFFFSQNNTFILYFHKKCVKIFKFNISFGYFFFLRIEFLPVKQCVLLATTVRLVILRVDRYFLTNLTGWMTDWLTDDWVRCTIWWGRKPNRFTRELTLDWPSRSGLPFLKHFASLHSHSWGQQQAEEEEQQQQPHRQQRRQQHLQHHHYMAEKKWRKKNLFGFLFMLAVSEWVYPPLPELATSLAKTTMTTTIRWNAFVASFSVSFYLSF